MPTPSCAPSCSGVPLPGEQEPATSPTAPPATPWFSGSALRQNATSSGVPSSRLPGLDCRPDKSSHVSFRGLGDRPGRKRKAPLGKALLRVTGPCIHGIYGCMSTPTAGEGKPILTDATELFREKFGAGPACVVGAPGRVELLGNHTDYNQGLIMALAVDKHITLAVSPRADEGVEVVSTAYRDPARFELGKIEKDPGVPWANYVKGLLLQLQQRGVRLGGFNAALHSTIPPGAGLSSSAALLVATALAVRKLYPYSLTETGCGVPPSRDAHGEVSPLGHAEKMILAKACQAAENQYVGVNCGLLDHISSLYGRVHQVIRIDCLKLTVDWSPMDGDLAVVVCHSGVKHALVGGEYNDRRQHCESAARTLGVPSLRFATLDQLEANRGRLADRDYGCARHVVGENQRVTEGSRLLRAGQAEQFGELLYASHASSREFFWNSCPELDVLVELARSHPDCLGARLTGGGFGGATLNLVRTARVEAFRAHMAAGYQQRMGRPLESWVCQIVDGAA